MLKFSRQLLNHKVQGPQQMVHAKFLKEAC